MRSSYRLDVGSPWTVGSVSSWSLTILQYDAEKSNSLSGRLAARTTADIVSSIHLCEGSKHSPGSERASESKRRHTGLHNSNNAPPATTLTAFLPLCMEKAASLSITQ